MTYFEYIPSAPLNTYISRFWYLDHPIPYKREKILPTPWLNLIFNFGGALRGYEASCDKPFATCTDSWWVGLWDGYHIVEWPQDMQFLIVDFKPGGAYPFLAIPLFELHKQIAPLPAVWGNIASEIYERLCAAKTVNARFALLEQLLLARLCAIPVDEMNIVQYAITRIAEAQGMLSIRALSEHIGISQKHLITQFKRIAGGTPKELARLYRFQRVLKTLDPSQSLDYTTLAHQFHYYDQSHFNREFESFTGHTPPDYVRLRARIHAEYPERAPSLRELPIG